ncbi:hypothetical protein CHELA1G11_20538 [Hyphomicrobiales bacterium]|nr:hypothetical protein CHELA1G11_20538 [Hyphomicrobiales bacterium]CAH1690688.1 hypothetical protein CHELA1G2_20851 [Hyphomicrobiales bacterium]
MNRFIDTVRRSNIVLLGRGKRYLDRMAPVLRIARFVAPTG